ncbi:MAG TPA: IclR family transcriptional regulator C-terminal domain-containing protein [Eoetvoesiella sp.]
MGSNNTDPNVKTAFRVAEIIETFARERKPLLLSEVARHLDAPVSSCLALLRTLIESGYIYETGRRQGYYPTGRLLTMAKRISDADPILAKVSSALHDLCDATAETIIFAKLESNDKIMFLEVVESPQAIRYVAMPGTQRDVHTNSLGKALLSTLGADVRHKLLTAQPLNRYNDQTVTDAVQIENDIKQSIQRGWFETLGETVPGVGTIAWPLKVSGNDYAISIAGPMFRIEPNLVNLVQKLRLVCASLEQST